VKETLEIDKAWRSFLNGSSIILLRGIIQDTLESFFTFVVKEGLSSQNPSTVPAYRTAQETQDLQRLSGVYTQEFQFNYKGQNFSAKLPSFSHSLRRTIGNENYNSRLDSGEKIVILSNSYTNFFIAARQLGFYRNDDAHKKYKINDTGYALGVASTALQIVELSPIEVRNQQSLSILKDNLGSLLKGILKKEDPSLNIMEDELEEEQKPSQNIDEVNEESNRLESLLTFFEEGKEDILEKADKFEALIDKINENIITMRNEYQVIVKKPSELNNSRKRLEKTESKSISSEVEESIEPIDMENNLSSMKEEFESPLTPQQALYEMLLLQKAMKRKFKCKNWENLAQGPFREMIIKEKIKNKEEFFKNQFIRNRYNENKHVMDELIESKLGEEFFGILSRLI